MSLKQLNLGATQSVPTSWMPETRSINYEYGPLRVHPPLLPQEPTRTNCGQPLKGTPFGINEEDQKQGGNKNR
jgi:hypothetical protein